MIVIQKRKIFYYVLLRVEKLLIMKQYLQFVPRLLPPSPPSRRANSEHNNQSINQYFKDKSNHLSVNQFIKVSVVFIYVLTVP